MITIGDLWRKTLLAGLALAAGMTQTTWGQQTLSCGNAFYDDGMPVRAWELKAGNPDEMFAVRFELADFGYEPGTVEIAGFCAGNLLYTWGGALPNEVFIYPDDDGRPDDNVVIGHGTIHTESELGASIVMLAEPVVLHGDFWLVARGYAPFADGTMYMDTDAEPDGGHSFFSYDGIDGLIPNVEWSPYGDFCLRAYLQPARWTSLTAGMAHVSGANGSQWRSKLGVLNTADVPNELTLSYLHGSSIETESIELGPGELAAWDDVVVELFGVDGESSGAIKVRADEPVLVSARTFNVSGGGTFGQYMPAVREADAMSFGQLGRLSLLSNSDTFRSNVGFLNLGRERAVLRVTIHDATGTVLGSLEIVVPAGRWRQQNDVFAAIGAGEVANGYATVELLTEGGSVWGYASVIDNATGDPTMVPLAIQ